MGEDEKECDCDDGQCAECDGTGVDYVAGTPCTRCSGSGDCPTCEGDG